MRWEMDIDKEIEELEKIIVDRLDTARAYCGNQLCDAGRWVAEGIVPKYRKADEVRKEAAKEILDEVAKHYGGAWLVELYKKFGIEVDR